MSRWDDFERELEQLINRHSMEQDSNTPDFVLARYLRNCLDAWCEAVHQRELHRPWTPTAGQEGSKP